MTSFIDTIYAFKMLRVLTQDFKDTKAFKVGIIDENGNKLREPSTTEKSFYNKFYRLAFNLKQIVEKVPLGRTTFARYATALALLKEECSHSKKIEDYFLTFLENNDIIIPEVYQTIEESVYNYNKHQYIDVFGIAVDTLNDEVIGELHFSENFTTGVDMGGGKMFSGSRVFDCDTDTFMKCRFGKDKYKRYKTYVGENDEIRHYGRQNPKAGIVLHDSKTGAMLYLRRPKQ